MQGQPYLCCGGCCKAAVEFYKQALGAQVTMRMRYKDSPDPPPPDMVADHFGVGWMVSVALCIAAVVMQA